MRGVLLMIGAVFFLSCTDDNCKDAVEPLSVTLEVERLEETLFESTSASEVESFLGQNKDFSTFFLNSDQYPHDSILAKRIFTLIENPAIDTLYQESVQAFQNIDEVVNVLESALGRLKYYYPETRTPKVQTIVSGLYKDLFISNDHIMIGLDFFIGENASYKPTDIPNYILRRYNTEHLPAIVMQYISSQYVVPGSEDTMLSEMIDMGKSYYLLSKIMPCTSERILIGYTQEEWDDSFENDQIIWANFVQNEILYETNHTIKQKFLAERPNVYEIGDKCPGRIGAWLGWQIVNSYMDRSGISVQELMKETNHNKIFTQSGYKPG
ncbi:MAG: gliding motility lipoprotein GldB [Cyclobacteriaceae bacterium]